MSFYPSQTDLRLLYQKQKSFFVKLYLLNEKRQIIDELQGELTEGSYTIDGNSDIRRIANLTFYIRNKTYFTNQYSKIWFDKIVDIKLGILDNKTNDIVYYSLGLFVFDESTFRYDNVTRSLTVSCLDLMSTFSGVRGGTLRGLKTLISYGEVVVDVVRDIVEQLGGVSKYIINEHSVEDYRTIPYNLDFGTGTTVYEMLKKIADVFGNIEFFFDTDGTFVWQEIPTKTEDMILFDNDVLDTLIIGESINRTFQNTKNAIEVWGLNDISARLLLVDRMPTTPNEEYNYLVMPSSPYAVKVSGDKHPDDFEFNWLVLSDGEYSLIPSEQLCLERCDYEMYVNAALKNTLELQTILIPWLMPNMKFSYRHKSDEEENIYLTQRISFDFTFQSCSISSIQFNPLYSWW